MNVQDFQRFTPQILGNDFENKMPRLSENLIGEEPILNLMRQYQKSFSDSEFKDSDPAFYALLHSESKLIKQVLDANTVQSIPECSINLRNCSLIWSCKDLLAKRPALYK